MTLDEAVAEAIRVWDGLEAWQRREIAHASIALVDAMDQIRDEGDAQ